MCLAIASSINQKLPGYHIDILQRSKQGLLFVPLEEVYPFSLELFWIL